MAALREYGIVRVVRLLKAPEEYDGWCLNRRPPRPGDMGVIVDILQTPGVPDDYVVESSDAGGITIWLGDFLAEELEPVEASEYVPQRAER